MVLIREFSFNKAFHFNQLPGNVFLRCYFSKHYISTAQFCKIAFGERKLLTGSPKLVSLSNASRQGAWPTARRQQPGILDVGGVTSVQILAGRRLWSIAAHSPFQALHLVCPRCTHRWACTTPTVRRTSTKSLVPPCLPNEIRLWWQWEERPKYPGKNKSEF